ncbi:MAG: hypothetical protein LBB17_00015 [Puniceicoccales bacterium]|jgi:hypothetical protein|nr:hypothetical protein [Puniceicoccales bacterium]
MGRDRDISETSLLEEIKKESEHAATYYAFSPVTGEKLVSLAMFANNLPTNRG